MNKAAINKMRAAAPEGGARLMVKMPTEWDLARAVEPSGTQDAPERPQERGEAQAVNLSPETIDALVGGFSRELRRILLDLGPILARIAAADTIHTVDRPPRVFGSALLEAQAARAIMAEAGVQA